MKDKLLVKEHLKNGSLYHSAAEHSSRIEWKYRLLRHHSMSRQINEALQTRTGTLNWFIYIGVPMVCILFVFAVYFGFLSLDQWLGNLGSIADWKIPPIGLKEVAIFIVAVNCLTFLIRKRPFVL